MDVEDTGATQLQVADSPAAPTFSYLQATDAREPQIGGARSRRCCNCCCRRKEHHLPYASAESMMSYSSCEGGEEPVPAWRSFLPMRIAGRALGAVSTGVGMLWNVVTLPAQAVSNVRRRASSSNDLRTRSGCCLTGASANESLDPNGAILEPLGYAVTQGAERSEVDTYDLTDPKQRQRWLTWQGEVPEGRVQTERFRFRVVGSDAVGLRRLDATVKRHIPKTFKSENMMGNFPVGDHDFEFPEVKIPSGMTVRGEYTTVQRFVDALGREVCPRRELRYRIVRVQM